MLNRTRIELQWRSKPGKTLAKPQKQGVLNQPHTLKETSITDVDVPIEFDENFSVDGEDSEDEVGEGGGSLPLLGVPLDCPKPRQANAEEPDRREELVSTSQAEIDGACSLYKLMCGLRQRVSSLLQLHLSITSGVIQIMARENIVAPEDVLDDATLQYLSATCPQGKETLVINITWLMLVFWQIIFHLSTT